MIGYIYVTSNDVNDILYVGKRQKPKFEKCYRGSGTHLKLAMSRYGKCHFHTVMLEACDSKEELNEAERKRRHLKPIAQIDKVTDEVIKIWADWGEASEILLKEKHGRRAYSHIAECCNGKRSSAYGFKWKYASEVIL